jgi:biotin synthase
VVREHLGTRGRIWAAIGLDQAPCDMGCRFCAFASAWTRFTKPHEMSVEESLGWAAEFIRQRADYLILRTSEQYPLEKLLAVGRVIASRKPDTVRLIANTRLANDAQLAELKQAGFYGIYKTIRLREGVDTAFDPAVRLEQIRQARAHGLRVFGLVEPVGPEHSDEEIVDAITTLRDEVHTALVGAMARVPVEGSPLYGYGAVGAQRLAAITAVFILAMADHFEDVEVVCSHPPHAEILRAGASGVVVEVGAIPRDTKFAQTEWRGLNMTEAQKLLRQSGYDA